LIDLHCDTLMLCALEDGYLLLQNSGCISLEKMQAGDMLAQCFAIFVLSGEAARQYGCSLSPYEYYQKALSAYKRQMQMNSDLILPALCAEDVLKNRAAGRMSSVLTVEDAVLLEGNIQRLQQLHEDGVRMMSLCWNYENELCYPNSDDKELMGRGLKEFGIECLEQMNALGIIADVSHLSEGGFWDVVRYSKKPFAASHSCAGTLCPHRRNLSDEQLGAIADCGGVVGVNFYPEFLSPDADGSMEQVVRHIRHIHKVAGIDTLALGSDFDGFDGPCELDSCDKLPRLRAALERHFTQDELDKICTLNALRLFK